MRESVPRFEGHLLTFRSRSGEISGSVPFAGILTSFTLRVVCLSGRFFRFRGTGIKRLALATRPGSETHQPFAVFSIGVRLVIWNHEAFEVTLFVHLVCVPILIFSLFEVQVVLVLGTGEQFANIANGVLVSRVFDPFVDCQEKYIVLRVRVSGARGDRAQWSDSLTFSFVLPEVRPRSHLIH